VGGRPLADPTRIALLELLNERARPVSELARSLGVRPDRLYHHLDVLEQSGLVRLAQIRPRRVYEAVPLGELGSQTLTENDRLELIAAVFELVRASAESAHRRSQELHLGVHSLFLTPRQRAAFAAELGGLIERWAQTPRSRGAHRTRVMFAAVPLAEPGTP
jgi:DNA-binding transcriptional ArsR family regulator